MNVHTPSGQVAAGQVVAGPAALGALPPFSLLVAPLAFADPSKQQRETMKPCSFKIRLEKIYPQKSAL